MNNKVLREDTIRTVRHAFGKDYSGSKSKKRKKGKKSITLAATVVNWPTGINSQEHVANLIIVVDMPIALPLTRQPKSETVEVFDPESEGHSKVREDPKAKALFIEALFAQPI